MNIGVDLDEILADFITPLLDYYNAVYGTRFTKKNVFSYNLWEVWGGTPDQDIAKLYAFYATPEFRNLQPVPGAQEGIRALTPHHELIVITSRASDLLNETQRWLAAHFPGMFAQVHLANIAARLGSSTPKALLCQRLGIDVMIEDSLTYAQECAPHVSHVLLMDAPWNQSNSLPRNVKRVFSWEEIVGHIRQMSNSSPRNI